MTDPTGPDRPDDGHSGPENQFDLRRMFPPDMLADLEAAARAKVRGTPAGVTDATTGTLRFPDHAPADQPVVIEYLGDDGEDQEEQRLLPEWMTDPAVRRHAAAELRHRAAFHAIRLPVYLGRASRLAVLGAWVALRDSWHYQRAGDYAAMINEARRKEYGHDHIAALRKERREVERERRREPLTVLAASGVTTYAAVDVALWEVGGWVTGGPFLLPLLAALAALGYREKAQRAAADGGTFAMLDHIPADEAPVVTPDTVTEALRAAGVLREDQDVSLIGHIRKVGEDAEEFTIKLPHGVTVSKVQAAAEALAGAWGVDTDWLDIRQAGHPGRVSVWICHSDPFSSSRPSPLLRHVGPLDAWRDGVPVSFDRRAETVRLLLRDIMLLIGGATRAGKGMLLRNLICGLALDPRVNIRIVDGKPTGGEHLIYAKVAATMFARNPQRLDVLLDAYEAEIARREDRFVELGISKLSEKYLDEFPVEILFIDELATYTRPTVEGSKKRMARLANIAATGAAFGVLLVAATQHPDADIVSGELRANMSGRIAVRTSDPEGANAILGRGAVGRGMRAHEIPRSHRGLAWWDLDGVEAEYARSFLIDQEDADEAEVIIDRGVEIRRAVGRLPGQFDDPIERYLTAMTGLTSVAGGPGGRGRPGLPEQRADTPHILQQLLAVFESLGNPERLTTSAILERLAAVDPDTWSPEALKVDPDAEDFEATYTRIGGGALRREIDDALKGTDRKLISRKWSADGGGRGYVLAEVRIAAGLAPE